MHCFIGCLVSCSLLFVCWFIGEVVRLFVGFLVGLFVGSISFIVWWFIVVCLLVWLVGSLAGLFVHDFSLHSFLVVLKIAPGTGLLKFPLCCFLPLQN